MLGLGRTSIFRLIREGRLDVVRIGRRTLVKAQSIRALIESDLPARSVASTARSFSGTIEQLKLAISSMGFVGTWQAMPRGYWRFLCQSGAILNWWPTTGTLNVQGPAESANAFERALDSAIAQGRPWPAIGSGDE
jgi:hypothetical protein